MAPRRIGGTKPIADPACATPVDIDYRNADLDAAQQKHTARIQTAMQTAHGIVGDRGRPVGRSRRAYNLTDAEAEEKLRAMAAEGRDNIEYGIDAPGKCLERLESARADLVPVEAERGALDAEYARRPWPRYVLVSGGHLHSGYVCAGGTLRPTTQRQWWPELSGKDFDAAIKELGKHAHTLCTHCFPDAPVLPKPVDVKTCPGSRKSGKPGTFKRQYPNGSAECTGCDERKTLTPTGNIRAHRTPRRGE